MSQGTFAWAHWAVRSAIPGNGGSLGFADPERRLAFGLTKNLMTATTERRHTTAYRVAEAIRGYTWMSADEKTSVSRWGMIGGRTRRETQNRSKAGVGS